MDYEGLKHELKRRDEEIDILNGQLDELVRLKDIAERQLEEALETLKSEREQKNELRRELSGYLSYDSIGNLPLNLEDPNEEDFDSGYKSNGDVLMSTPRNSDIFHPGPKLASDLFTELNLTEIQKLKQQLLQVYFDLTCLCKNVTGYAYKWISVLKFLLISQGTLQIGL